MIEKLNVNKNGTLSQNITLYYDNNAIITAIRPRKLIVTMNTTVQHEALKARNTLFTKENNKL